MTETLLQGDCLELLPTIQDHSIDMILADLPMLILVLSLRALATMALRLESGTIRKKKRQNGFLTLARNFI